jgi:hypothetical protein
LHYRGTDKLGDSSQTNWITHAQFLTIVEEFLSRHTDIETIFIATDDACFLDAAAYLRPISQDQQRSHNGQPLWKYHDQSQNTIQAKQALIDCFLLSHCDYVLKGMSQLSAWAKILNPALKIARVPAFTRDWFPESHIPAYASHDPHVTSLLQTLQAGDPCMAGKVYL